MLGPPEPFLNACCRPPPPKPPGDQTFAFVRLVVAARAFCGLFLSRQKSQPFFRVSVCVHARRSLGRPVDLALFFSGFFVRAIETHTAMPPRHRAIPLCAAVLATFIVSTACQAHPQGTILSGLDRNAVGTTIHLTPAAWNDPVVSAHVRTVVGSFPTLVAAVAAMSQSGGGDGGLVAGIGLSPTLWARWGTFLPAPVGILAFPGYEGVGGWPRMPATGGDLFVHAKAARRDVLYALIDLFVKRLGDDAVSGVATVDAWTNTLDGQNRDLTGFVDGTVNAPSDQRAAAGLISAALDPAHVNGSYAITQVWRHDLAAFRGLNQSMQEAVFGRTKAKSAPLPHQAPSSHVARVRQSALGYFIVRQAMPWGDPAGEAGLLFVAYAGDARRFDAMCHSMVGSGPGMAGAPHAVPDAIMRFSTPTTGNYWYFPSVEVLAQLAKRGALLP